MPHEFELIAQILRGLGDTDGLALGPGDDCALVDLEAGHRLASSIDSFSAGRHFPHAAHPWLIAQRSFRASLSDLAAMGAKPQFALIALCMPESDQQWLTEFIDGIRDAASRFKCAIAGGNLSEGALSVTISVHGSVPVQGALLRSGAEPGQDVYVSGVLGGAAAALPSIQQGLDRKALQALTGGDLMHPLMRYWLPEPRLDLGQALIGKATAAIDISDGLYADAWHLADASQTGIRIDRQAVPLMGDATQSDDYELLFTAPTSLRSEVKSLSEDISIRITAIGETLSKPGVWLGEKQIPKDASGYKHFG